MLRCVSLLLLIPGIALAQACPEKNLNYQQLVRMGLGK